MQDILFFLDTHYANALKLVSDFDITKEKVWDSKDYLNELYVQVGHVYNVLFPNEAVNEEGRVINNLGDELADVLLQLINLARILNIDMREIETLGDYQFAEVTGLPILLGQLTEAVMEINGCRFRKTRVGFNTEAAFIKDRIFKMFTLTYNLARKHNLDMVKEFSAMLEDANGFLADFRKSIS